MKINILAFGIAKEVFQRPVIEIDLEGTPTISNLKSELEKNYPRLSELASYMIAVNDEYATVDLRVNANDEIAIIPPVSGG
jgi:molybdopterin synthase sulfur carrier subunit